MNYGSETVGHALASYVPQLIRLAEKNMSRPLQVRVGAEDLANSVVKSVFRAFSEGKLSVSVEDDAQFWKYLVVVSLNKIRKKARDHSAAKRNISLDQPLSDIEFLIKETRAPSDDEGEQVASVLNQLESELDEEGRIILQGKLEGEPNRVIAAKLKQGEGVSTKTVTRRWNEIQARLREIIESLDLG